MYPDLYYVPPEVATATQLALGCCATLSAGDEFEVVVAAPATSAAARKHLSRSLPSPFSELAVSLDVDGVVTSRSVFCADAIIHGWQAPDDDGGGCMCHRFRVDRTVGSASAAGRDTAAADGCPDLGRLALTWRPSRRTGKAVRPQTSAPAATPSLTERDAIKNPSLAAGVGTSVKVAAPATAAQ